MITRLDQARADAAELERLQQSAAELPKLEAEAEVARVRAESERLAAEYSERLDSDLAAFREAKRGADARLRSLLGEAAAVVAERRKLAEWASALWSVANALGGVQWRAEFPDAPLNFGVRDEARVRGQQALIDRGIENADLMAFRLPFDAAEADVARVLSRLTGDHLARQDGELRGLGPVLIVETGPDGKDRQRWG